MLPEGAVDPLPSNTTVFSGSDIVLSVPASATGGRGAASTVIVTDVVDVAPLLSVTVNSHL